MRDINAEIITETVRELCIKANLMLPEDVSMVPAMIQLARGLSLRIVAEGVENDAQYRWLQAAGVEVLQGHLFGCALPQEAFSARYLSPVREDANL